MVARVFCPPVMRTAYTLHREDCAALQQSKYVATCEWAKGMTIEDARDMMRWHDLRECQRCYPLMRTVRYSWDDPGTPA